MQFGSSRKQQEQVSTTRTLARCAPHRYSSISEYEKVVPKIQ
jgi:hypothetical protein